MIKSFAKYGEKINDIRYGVFLIPPKNVASAINNIRTDLQNEFGFQAAMRFMVHATLKGFFKLNGDIQQLINTLDHYLQEKRCFDIRMISVGAFQRQRVIKIGIKSWIDDHDRPNSNLRNLHKDIYKAVQQEPIEQSQIKGRLGKGFIAADCEFTSREYIGTKFSAHFTLAFKDVTENNLNQALIFAKHKFQSLSPKTFSNGTSIGLYKFYSESWQRNWWETLMFETINTWHLAST